MAKTLLNSSEKSNFILNMTEETYSKLASIGLFAACFAVPLFTILPEVDSAHTYSAASIGMAIVGVYGLIMALIAIMKKYVRKEQLIPVLAFAVLIGWSVVSLADSYDMDIAFRGFPQRGEGVLSTLYYFGFFVTGLSIKREKALNTVIYGVIGSGLFNSAWALIQIFTEGHKLSHYSTISIFFDFAASGLAHSPVFLAFLLTLSMTAALVTAAVTDNNKKRIFCIVSSFIFGFVMINTLNVISIAGLIFAGIAFIAAVFVKKAPKIRLAAIAAPAAAVAIAFFCINTSTAVHSIFKYKFRDGYIIWTGDAYKRVGASGNYDPRVLNIEDVSEVYSRITKKSVNILKKYPLTGSGPEQMEYPQIYTLKNTNGVEMENMDDILALNHDTIDKVYNEYLYIGATRGVISMLALIAIMGSTVVIGYRCMRKRRTDESITLFFVALGGALGFIICCSSVGFAPVLWAAAGASCANIEKIHLPKKSGSKAKSGKSQKTAEKSGKTEDAPKAKAPEKSKKPEEKTAAKSASSVGKKKNSSGKKGKK